MAISIGSNSSSTGSRGSDISSRLDFSNVMSLAKDFRTAYAAQKEEMEKERSVIEQLRYELRNDQGSVAQRTFMNFYQPLSDTIANFSKNGMTPETMASFNLYKDQYATKIAPIYEAAKRRLALEQIQENYRNAHPDDNIFYENDAHSISIDDFVNNPHLTSGKIISAKTLLTQVAGVGEMLRIQGGLPTGDMEADGVTPKMDKITVSDVNNFLNTYIDNGNYDPNNNIWDRNGNSKEKNAVMGSIMENITRNAGITDEDAPWIDEGTKRSIRQYIGTGLYQGVTDNRTSSSSGGTSSSSGDSGEWKKDPRFSSSSELNQITNASPQDGLFKVVTDQTGNPVCYSYSTEEYKPIHGVYQLKPQTQSISFSKNGDPSSYKGSSNEAFLYNPEDESNTSNPLQIAVVVQQGDGSPVKIPAQYFTSTNTNITKYFPQSSDPNASNISNIITIGDGDKYHFGFNEDKKKEILNYLDKDDGGYHKDYQSESWGDTPHLYVQIENEKITDVHIWDSSKTRLSKDKGDVGVHSADQPKDKSNWYRVSNDSGYYDEAEMVRKAISGNADADVNSNVVTNFFNNVNLANCDWAYVDQNEIRTNENGDISHFALAAKAYGSSCVAIKYKPDKSDYTYYICFQPEGAKNVDMKK